jgi:hypothetical protein
VDSCWAGQIHLKTHEEVRIHIGKKGSRNEPLSVLVLGEKKEVSKGSRETATRQLSCCHRSWSSGFFFFLKERANGDKFRKNENEMKPYSV